jgi:hypothetical protein
MVTAFENSLPIFTFDTKSRENMDKMPRLKKDERYVDIIRKGLDLLAEQQDYRQVDVLAKFETLGKTVSRASLSNIVTGARTVGLPVMRKASDGLEEIIGSELGMKYNPETRAFALAHAPDWRPYIIPVRVAAEPESPAVSTYFDGRVSIRQKTDFISSAQKEVIEVGVRLKTFADYFISRKEKEFKDYITTLLQRGVNFKAYMLDPDCQEARMYFDDRKKVQEEEGEAVAEMKRVVEKLRRLVRELAQRGYRGKFEVFLYRHIPYNHFLVVDPQEKGAKMMVSHYIYGIKRADCPVWEFTRNAPDDLYAKYEKSLDRYLRDARLLQ